MSNGEWEKNIKTKEKNKGVKKRKNNRSWKVHPQLHVFFFFKPKIFLILLFGLCVRVCACVPVRVCLYVCVWLWRLCPSKSFFSSFAFFPLSFFLEREAGASSLEQGWQDLNYRSWTGGGWMEERERASKKWGERESRQAGEREIRLVCMCVGDWV